MQFDRELEYFLPVCCNFFRSQIYFGVIGFMVRRTKPLPTPEITISNKIAPARSVTVSLELRARANGKVSEGKSSDFFSENAKVIKKGCWQVGINFIAFRLFKFLIKLNATSWVYSWLHYCINTFNLFFAGCLKTRQKTTSFIFLWKREWFTVDFFSLSPKFNLI